jgi:predicted TIM-barrel fold metal-dependent hydrolase
MFLHPERPSKEAVLEARDRMLRDHPNLRVIGCHLGSMEEDVNDVARRLDQYPNFAVDTAERIIDLVLQPREKVRAFLVQYQDRVLYGTDLGLMPWQEPVRTIHEMEETYARDWKFFATDEMVDYSGRRVRGLGLPDSVLRKLFRNNAIRWVPGLAPTR